MSKIKNDKLMVRNPLAKSYKNLLLNIKNALHLKKKY